MNNDQDTGLADGAAASKKLSDVLGQNEQARDMVDECAEQLVSVNAALKLELAAGESLPRVENALEKNEAIEDKAQEAAEKLTAVNKALADEIEERRKLEHQLVIATEQKEHAFHAALHDALTGLPNRALFNDRLVHGLSQARRHGWNLAVMFLDLDDFKPINDLYGHDAGDCVLRTIAARLKANTRSDDTVSRLGGDEFLFLLMSMHDEKDVQLIVEKILNVIRQPCDVSSGDGAISSCINASIGIAVFPRDGTTADALIRSAGAARYRAKREKSGYAYANARAGLAL